MPTLLTTVIFKADLRDSTPLFKSLAGSALSDLLTRQKQLVGGLIAQHNGHTVKGEGDAFWATFPSVTAAAQAAIAIQQELRAQQTGRLEEDRIALRIVIALGDVLHQSNDIFGYPVNLAARIETVTPADEIYLSHAAWLALNQAEIETAFVDEFHFKGVAQPERVYKIVQLNRTRILHNHVVISSDLRRFSRYQRTHTLEQIEALLVQLEHCMRLASVDHGGTVRVAVGDSFIITFPQIEPAFRALDALCAEWDAFISTRAIDCTLAVGAHYGDLTMFRSYLYGEAINLTSGLGEINGLLYPEPTRSGVVISDKLAALLAGSPWAARLRAIPPGLLTSEVIANDRRLAGQMAGRALYEFLPGHLAETSAQASLANGDPS